MNLSHLTVDQLQELRKKDDPNAARLEELRKKATLTDPEGAEKSKREKYGDALEHEWRIRHDLNALPLPGAPRRDSIEIDWMPDYVPRA